MDVPRTYGSIATGGVAVVAAIIVGLGVGGLATVLGTTEERCWVAMPGRGGGLEYRDVSPGEAGGPFGGPGLPISGGCDSGVVTVPGIVGGVGLPAGALIIGWVRRRPTTGAAR